ncbi:MAG: hypothetical protein NVS9B15_16160 [Acidobacteriaceae bacterium]
MSHSTTPSIGAMRSNLRMAGRYCSLSRLRFPMIVALLLLFADVLPGRAQVSVYGTFSPIRISTSANGNVYGSYWDRGFGGGVTLTVLPLGPLSLGLDLRGSTTPGSSGTDTALGGLKLGLRVPLISLKPYIQASGGYLRTRTSVGVGNIAGATSNYGFGVYEIMGGLDTAIFPHVDLRLIEIGAGQGKNISGPTSGLADISILTVNTGVVLHF